MTIYRTEDGREINLEVSERAAAQLSQPFNPETLGPAYISPRLQAAADRVKTATPPEIARPCPFCGAAAHVQRARYSERFFTVMCENDECYVQPSLIGVDRAQAVERWNTRP